MAPLIVGNQRDLCIAVTLLQPYFHGRRGTGAHAKPEWPPSPLRVFQAVVAAAAARWGEQGRLTTAVPALKWLEGLGPPIIVAPAATPTSRYVLSVPNNSMDVVAAAWTRGNYSNQGDANPATHRTMKSVQAMRLNGDRAQHTIHYIWPLLVGVKLGKDVEHHVETLTAAARSVVALGWGVDVAIGDATLENSWEAARPSGERWMPNTAKTERHAGSGLRIPIAGTLDSLVYRHEKFLSRISADAFVPVPPLTKFGVVQYSRESDAPPRPFAAFAFKPIDGDREFASFRIERAVCVAAMLRHAALTAASADLDPTGWRTAEWIEQFVAGHGPRKPDGKYVDECWPRFSFLPLPSIGHTHAGGSIRRAIIAEPTGGDGRSAQWIARQLHGMELIDEHIRQPVARLESIEPDEAEFGRVFPYFASRSVADAGLVWASVSPVILSGYDDGKPAKRSKLLSECLRRAGIDLSTVLSIDSRPTAWHSASNASMRGFKRPQYLTRLPACHVRIEFKAPFAGPLSIGAGRHCGLGVMARLA